LESIDHILMNSYTNLRYDSLKYSQDITP